MCKDVDVIQQGFTKKNDLIIHESIIGTTFEGRICEEVSVGKYKAVVPYVKGKGYLIGINNLIIDTDDPLRYGFLFQ